MGGMHPEMPFMSSRMHVSRLAQVSRSSAGAPVMGLPLPPLLLLRRGAAWAGAAAGAAAGVDVLGNGGVAC